MRTPLPSTRLPRLLFVLTAGCGVCLLALVLLCPLLAAADIPASGWPRLVGLFAHDAVVRHTAIASALGLLATAWIFFRSTPVALLRPHRKRRPPRPPRPPAVAGA
jgi:hypothetical protein